MKTVVVAGGGTGGHLFAAIAVGEKLQERGYSAHLVTDQRCENYLPADLPFKKHIVDLRLRSGILGRVTGIFKLVKATGKAVALLRKLKPDIVIGFGGYPSFPTMLAALILRIPIIVHEQNCFMGKSNAFFAGFAKLISLSYPETKNLKESMKNRVVVGNIVRRALMQLPKKENFDQDPFTILVFAGSQGAKFFSKIIPESLLLVKASNPSSKFRVIEQVAGEDIEAIRQLYQEAGIECHLAPFFHNMHELYGQASLLISRSGASTIAEISVAGLPAILIPYPYASDNHQLYNAKALEAVGAVWCFEQNNLTPLILANKILLLMQKRDLLKEASIKLKNRNTDGAALLADTVEKIIN